MTIEEVLNALTVNEYTRVPNSPVGVALGAGLIIIVFSIICLINAGTSKIRTLAIISIVSGACWCVVGLAIMFVFPQCIAINVEVPTSVSQEQLTEYFILEDITWDNDKITCKICPRADAYDAVVAFLNERKGETNGT